MGMANYAFADGHAKALTPMDTLATGSSPYDNMWQRALPSSAIPDKNVGGTSQATVRPLYEKFMGIAVGNNS